MLDPSPHEFAFHDPDTPPSQVKVPSRLRRGCSLHWVLTRVFTSCTSSPSFLLPSSLPTVQDPGFQRESKDPILGGHSLRDFSPAVGPRSCYRRDCDTWGLLEKRGKVRDITSLNLGYGVRGRGTKGSVKRFIWVPSYTQCHLDNVMSYHGLTFRVKIENGRRRESRLMNWRDTESNR